MKEQLQRTAGVLGEGGVLKLQRARVAVFGIGGVGGYVVEALARAGVGALDLVDADVVSESNLNRQIIALRSTVGEYKTKAAAARVQDIDPDISVQTHEVFFSPENAAQFDFSRYDYVVDAVDTVAAKVELAVRCDAMNVPLIAAMGAGNKLDPSKLQIADVYKTSVCPLARAMRTTLRKKGVKHLTVAWSTEEALRPASAIDDGSGLRKDVPGSTAFVPSAMGLLIASHVVRRLAITE